MIERVFYYIGASVLACFLFVVSLIPVLGSFALGMFLMSYLHDRNWKSPAIFGAGIFSMALHLYLSYTIWTYPFFN